MVRTVLGVMTRPIRGLHEAAYVLAGFSILSQVLALVRDRTFAHLFGAGPTLDAYFAAFRIPDLLFAFLTLFVSSFALVPLLSGKDKDAQGVIVGNVLLAFGVSAIVVCGILFFAMPTIVPFLFPGFPPETLASTILLSRIMLVQPVLLGLSSIATSVVQVLRQFIIFALAPILYNVGIIAGALFLYPQFGITGLAWGVALGALLHVSAQIIPILGHARHIVRPSWNSLRASIVEVALPSMPRALALSSQQVLLLVFASIASLTAAGTVSTLAFAFNLQSVPLTIIGVSYAAAIFPALSALIAKGNTELFMREVWAGVRHIVFWTFPAITLIIVLRAHIVRIILGTGAFSWDDTRLTAAVLACFAFSLIAQSVILIFSRSYYAAHSTLVPIVVNVGGAIVAGAGAYIAVVWLASAEMPRFFIEDLFRVADVPGTAILMIPIVYSLVMLMVACTFGYLFARRFGFEARVWHTLGTSFAASVIAATGAYGVLQFSAPLLPTTTFFGIFTQGLSAGIVGGLLWLLVLFVLKSQELKEIHGALLHFFKKGLKA
ncbi:MAG: lipid II flippase MurJ [Patescibacteria group bacterium]